AHYERVSTIRCSAQLDWGDMFLPRSCTSTISHVRCCYTFLCIVDVVICYRCVLTVLFSVFFFQAEDGIRDWSVTGVQTCALPIYRRRYSGSGRRRLI